MAPLPPPFTIEPARGEEDMATVRQLIRAYTDWLNLDLSYQGLEAELASLPGKYSPEQDGEMLLAWRNPDSSSSGTNGDGKDEVSEGRQILGIICLRKLDESQFIGHGAEGNGSLDGDGAPTKSPPPLRRGEVKRLYVVPEARGLGVGSALIQSLVDGVRAALEWESAQDDVGTTAYDELYLDTLPRMQGAIRQYTRVGFAPCARYYDSPVQETLYFRWRAKFGVGE